MDKKKFFEPEVKVVELDDRQIICMSNGEIVKPDPEQPVDPNEDF